MQGNQPSQYASSAASLLLDNYSLHFLPYCLSVHMTASLSETVLKPQWNMKHSTWMQGAENEQVQNQAFALLNNTATAMCTTVAGLGQAAACYIATETTLCQKHSMHCCIMSSANTAEDRFTYPRISSNFPKRRTQLSWCTCSHQQFQFILISLPYTKIVVKFLGYLCIVFLDNDSLQLHRDAHLSPWSQSILHT